MKYIINKQNVTINQDFNDIASAFAFGKSLGGAFTIHESNDGLTSKVPVLVVEDTASKSSSGPQFLTG